VVRCSILSDSRIIERVNSEMIPLAINISNQEIPIIEFPALKMMKNIYKSNDHLKKGFAGITILDPTGKHALSGIALLTPKLTDVLSYEGFTKILDSSYVRWEKVKKMDNDFKNGKFFSGLGASFSIAKEEFGKGVDNVSGMIELGAEIKASNVKDDDFSELKSHGVRRPGFETYPNIASIVPQIRDSTKAASPVPKLPARPNQPVFQPNQPIAQPTQPFIQPNQSFIQPNQSFIQPNQPNQPVFQPNQPVFQPNQSFIQPDQSFIQPNPNIVNPVQPNSMFYNPNVPAINQQVYNTMVLPPGWEMRYDPNGIPYYVDHNTRTTHWNPPYM